MQANEKICPQCAETAQAGSIICRYCTYNVVAHESTKGPDKPPRKTGELVIGSLGIVGLLGVVGAIGTVGGCRDKNGSGTTAARSADAATSTVTSIELARVYKENNAAAKERYGVGRISVTGTVKGVSMVLPNDPIVRLEGANEFSDVEASFDRASASKFEGVRRGQTVTVTCQAVTEAMSIPTLSGCSL